MKIIFSTGVAQILKGKLGDRTYCYLLSRRNMSTYSKKIKTFREYCSEFNPSDVHIIIYRGKRFGFFEYQIKEDGLYIWDIQLSRILQGRGLGTLILKHIERIALDKKSKKIVLFVYSKNPAIRLYQRLKFKITKDFPETLRVRMEKELF